MLIARAGCVLLYWGPTTAASRIVGVAAAAASRREILTATAAGWAAGAMVMAAGEYVSVSSQADSEAADLKRVQRALEDYPADETLELEPGWAGPTSLDRRSELFPGRVGVGVGCDGRE